MVTKTYCDCCNSEIDYRDSYHVKISPRDQGKENTINWHEVCKKCVNNIKEVKSNDR